MPLPVAIQQPSDPEILAVREITQFTLWGEVRKLSAVKLKLPHGRIFLQNDVRAFLKGKEMIYVEWGYGLYLLGNANPIPDLSEVLPLVFDGSIVMAGDSVLGAYSLVGMIDGDRSTWGSRSYHVFDDSGYATDMWHLVHRKSQRADQGTAE